MHALVSMAPARTEVHVVLRGRELGALNALCARLNVPCNPGWALRFAMWRALGAKLETAYSLATTDPCGEPYAPDQWLEQPAPLPAPYLPPRPRPQPAPAPAPAPLQSQLPEDVFWGAVVPDACWADEGGDL